jgi:protein arginine N-methyltransferase 1
MTNINFQYIDIMTVKKEDLTFQVPFQLTATRDDFVHALVAWFDISFSFCHKPIQFSTGPHARYTHWCDSV